MQQILEFISNGAVAPVADALTFIGNATVLLRLNGFTLLTDPNFLHAGDHAHLGYGLTSKRLTNPALEFNALPPFDAVLLSHYHGDHFDQFVERELPRGTPIITTAHAARKLSAHGFTARHTLAPYECVELRKASATLTITAMPGRHGPVGVASLLPPVMGSMIEFRRADQALYRIYISGDTLIHRALHEIPRRYPHIDLALIHLGGTRVLGILVTLDGKGGVAAMRLLDPQLTIPIHYEEYTVMKSPLSEFVDAVAQAGYSGRVRYLARGETYTL